MSLRFESLLASSLGVLLPVGGADPAFGQALDGEGAAEHLGGLAECLLELGVGLFLDSLCVLQLLDEFHLEELHLHDLLLLDLAIAALILQLTVHVPLDRGDPPLPVLLDLQQSEPLLLEDKLVLHLVVLFCLELNLVAALLELLLDGLGLLSLLPLGEEDGLLDLALFVLPLLLQDVVALTAHLRALNVHLQFLNFLPQCHTVGPLPSRPCLRCAS